MLSPRLYAVGASVSSPSWLLGIGVSWLTAATLAVSSVTGEGVPFLVEKVNDHCTWRVCGLTINIILVAFLLLPEAMKDHALRVTCLFLNRKSASFIASEMVMFVYFFRNPTACLKGPSARAMFFDMLRASLVNVV